MKYYVKVKNIKQVFKFIRSYNDENTNSKVQNNYQVLDGCMELNLTIMR